MPKIWRGHIARGDLDGYLRAFLDFWNDQLTSDDFEVGWQIVGSPGQYGELSSGNVVGVRFGLCYRVEREGWRQEIASQAEWQQVLNEFAAANQVPMSIWDVQIQGLTRIVSASDVLILKRNERRLWTPSSAYEDAEAALLQLWQRQELEAMIGVKATP